MSSKTETIAKNTAVLYLRMALVMAISFYASRLILQKLGVEDFGIYNVVGGVVVLFTFLNRALTGATQRFLNFELGRKHFGRLQRVFSAGIIIHCVIAGIVLLLAETIGLWFLNSQMSIPDGRLFAANCVFQLSVAGTLVSIIRVPYNALVIAYEHMSFLAILNIGEALAKLGILFLLGIGNADKLILYATLMFLILLLAAVINKIYCHKKFPQVAHCSFPRERKLFREMLAFSGWNLIPGIANLSAGQGGNMLLNVYAGVAVNAAMGIANQVNVAVYQFVSNFQMAFQPQITKSYAEGDQQYFFKLIFGASKISYFLMLALAVPAFFNMDFLLGIWLETVPAHTTSFAQLMLILCLIDALNGPLWMSIGATGDMRLYSICVSGLNLLNVPLSWIALAVGTPPECVLAVRIAMSLGQMLSRLIILRQKVRLPVRKFLREVCVPASIVTLFVVPATGFCGNAIANDWLSLFASTGTCLLIAVPAVRFFGLNANERALLSKMAQKIFNKIPIFHHGKDN